MADETLQTPQDELDLLKHEHETLKQQLGQQVAEMQSQNIRLTGVNRRLLDDVNSLKGQVDDGRSSLVGLGAQLDAARKQYADEAAAHAATQGMLAAAQDKLSTLREAVKPLISLVSSK
jgi:chromosome segregation ATPase